MTVTTDIFNIPDDKYTLTDRDWLVDTETNDLNDYTHLWNIVCRNWKTNEVEVFRNVHDRDTASRFRMFADKHVRYYIGHNLIGFDSGVLRKFCDVTLTPENTLDTLVLSRLFKYNRPGGHSMENWGKIVGAPKSPWNDFSQWSQELEDRCIGDTETNRLMLQLFEKQLLTKRWQLPIYLENTVEFLNNDLKRNGFYYDIDRHTLLKNELTAKVKELEEEFSTAFSPDFNPRSPKQRIDVLSAAGWKPVNKTKGYIAELRKKDKADKNKLEKYKTYGWTCDEENLSTLPETAPEAAKKLSSFLLLSSRLGDLLEWEEAYSPISHCIHPTITGLGAWTHRRSHQKPNCANIPALVSRKGLPQPYGEEMRGLWKPKPGKVLVGTDAEGIQLRVFCHYTNDKRLIDIVLKGDKKLGTDIHSVNMKLAGTDICKDRQVAKTYIYAKFLNASLPKIAEIFGCSTKEAAEADRRIMSYYPGWSRFKKKQVPADAARGYFIGLDGRLVFVPSEHHVLAGYLQNGESVIMKMANILWRRQLTEKGIPFWQVNDVQDEWQTETWPEYAEEVAATQVASFRTIGEFLNLNCRLDGSSKIGTDWAKTH